jgi:hypothetical protein
MLEGGLALITINMPFFWPVARRVLPESILGSVCSLVSLRSLDSRTGKAASKTALKNEGEGASTSSQTDIFNKNRQETKFDTYLMRYIDLETEGYEHPAGGENITMQRAFLKQIMRCKLQLGSSPITYVKSLTLQRGRTIQNIWRIVTC